MENKKKKYYLEGYLTIEASFLVPLILFLYLFLIFTAFFLYNRCLLAQDCYLLSFRGSVFTHWSEGYGEVVYGNLPVREMEEIQHYIEQRMIGLYEEGKYPAFQMEEIAVEADIIKVAVLIRGTTQIPLWREKEIRAEAEAAVINPVAIIRAVRREK